MTTQIISPTGQKNYAFGTYSLTQAYRLGDSVTHNGNIYTANDNIPANTAFAEGATGATWSIKVTGSTGGGGSSFKYSKEWHVDPVGGNDTTGNGAYDNPYATITKTFTQVGGNGQAVFLHHGIYNETVTCGLFNVDIIGDNRSGAFQSGTWNFTTNGNSSMRISGVMFSNTVTHSGNAGVYLYDCTVSGALLKTGNGYFEASGLSADSNAWSITGSGYLTVTNSRIGAVTVNNANAIVTLKDLTAVYTVNNASGTTVIDNSYVFSISNTSNAITTAAGSVTYVQDSQISSAAGAPTARVAMSGFWSAKNTIFDRANSVLGTNLGTVTRSDSIDVIGNISGNTAGFALGYRDIPQVAVAANATFALTDAGKHYYNTTAANFTLTIPNNSSVAFNTGSAITVVNQSANTLAIAQGTGVTLYMTGNATAGNRTLGAYGMASLMKVGTNTWFINGAGVA